MATDVHPFIADSFFSRGFHGALSGLFPIQLSTVAKESFVCNRSSADAGTGDRGDDRDLQPGECGSAEASAVSGSGPPDAGYAGRPLDGRGTPGVTELPGLF